MKLKSILVSQPNPAGESSPYISLAKKHNLKVDFRPFIFVEGANSKDVRLQKIDFSQYTAIILTSRNAVDHYFRLAEEMRYNVPSTMKYFCQSEAVAYYLQRYIIYRKRKIYIAGKNIEDLKPLLDKYPNEKFLLPTSDSLKDDIPEFLNSTKINWKRAVLYRTKNSDLSDLKDIKYDMLVFFSPQGIHSLFENFPDFKQNDTKIAIYGESTKQVAEEYGLEVTILAPTVEYPSLTMAIEKYIQEQ